MDNFLLKTTQRKWNILYPGVKIVKEKDAIYWSIGKYQSPRIIIDKKANCLEILNLLEEYFRSFAVKEFCSFAKHGHS